MAAAPPCRPEGGSPNREACQVARQLVPGVFLLVSLQNLPLQQVVVAPVVWSSRAPGPPLLWTEECCLSLPPPRSGREWVASPSLVEWGCPWHTREQSTCIIWGVPPVLPVTGTRQCNTLWTLLPKSGELGKIWDLLNQLPVGPSCRGPLSPQGGAETGGPWLQTSNYWCSHALAPPDCAVEFRIPIRWFPVTYMLEEV